MEDLAYLVRLFCLRGAYKFQPVALLNPQTAGTVSLDSYKHHL
jgi:hypothetical protein